ncbi:MAG: hypothetical protein ACKO41_02450 [Sphingomonadales bacterium]
MEVHHPHHVSHKKKWQEYVLEFVMLFVAVSLGFFAENVRERQIEKHREISYLRNVHEDLLLDLKNIDQVTNANTTRLAMLDSLHAELSRPQPALSELYYFIRNLALRATFESSHIGFDQIKSAGGFRMIRSAKIISGIQEYERVLSSTMKLEETRERTLEQARFKMARVLDAGTNYQMSLHQEIGTARFTRPQTAAPFAVADRPTFNELINMISIGLNTNRYLNSRLTTLKSIALELDSAIVQEYGEQFNH